MIQCILEWNYEHSTYFSFLYKLPDVTSLSWNQSWMRTHSLSTRWWIQAKSQHRQCCNPLTICELWACSSGSAGKNSIHSLPVSLPGEAGMRRGRSLDSRVALPLLPRRSKETLSLKKVSSFPGAWHTASEEIIFMEYSPGSSPLDHSEPHSLFLPILGNFRAVLSSLSSISPRRGRARV